MKNSCIVDECGNKMWYLNGKLHRTDGPAIKNADGTKMWCVNGKCHRTDGPAVEWADGTKVWCVNGKCHRADGPAVENAVGLKQWWVDDRYLGDNDEGFWTLWELLTDEQRNSLDLLLHLPSVVRP